MDKPRLRSALKRLRRVEFDRSDWANVAMAPQEMLDFLAMAAGIKPVYLLGRGFDDLGWVSGIEELTRGMRLHVLTGPKWHSEPERAAVPAWFAEIRRPGEREVDHPMVYVCRSGGVADALRTICSAGATTTAQEARLLGYPECCVRDHYRGARMFDEAFFLMVQRTANGDPGEMRRIVVEDVEVVAETQRERTLLREATTLRPAPYTSVYMCGACAADLDSPAMRLSRQYEALARAVDPCLADEIKVYQGAFER